MIPSDFQSNDVVAIADRIEIGVGNRRPRKPVIAEPRSRVLPSLALMTSSHPPLQWSRRHNSIEDRCCRHCWTDSRTRSAWVTYRAVANEPAQRDNRSYHGLMIVIRSVVPAIETLDPDHVGLRDRYHFRSIPFPIRRHRYRPSRSRNR